MNDDDGNDDDGGGDDNDVKKLLLLIFDPNIGLEIQNQNMLNSVRNVADGRKQVDRRLQGRHTEELVAGQFVVDSNPTWSSADVQLVVSGTSQGRRTRSTSQPVHVVGPRSSSLATRQRQTRRQHSTEVYQLISIAKTAVLQLK